MRTFKHENKTIHVAASKEDVLRVVSLLGRHKGEVQALDFETTALRPEHGRVRLTSLSFSDNVAYVIDHDYSVKFAKMANVLLRRAPYWVFNAKFEGRWFSEYAEQLGPLTEQILDVAQLQRSIMGGGPLWLKTMAKRALGVEMDKEQQSSDWSASVLTDEQYTYAGLDAIYTREIALHWLDQMEPNHWRGFHVINNSWRAINEIEDTGMLLDKQHHAKLVAMWTRRRDAAEATFRKFVPENIMPNIRSKKQFSDMLRMLLDDEAIEAWDKTWKTGQLKSDRKLLTLMSYNAPYPLSRMLAAYMVFNRADKYIGTYGSTLATIQDLSSDNRIHSRINIAQAVTGRMSSSGPNQQNYMRAPKFRRCFIAGRKRKMIIADYSSIEVRVLAELSGDKILLNDVIYGDVHSQSAIAIYGVPEAEFMAAIKRKDPKAKEMRSRAKGFTFQLLYGAGAEALSVVLRCTVDEARDAINKWAARYSRAFNYRQIMFEKMTSTGFMPCVSGRTIFVHRNERSMPVAANYPIQGSAGDVMYSALYYIQKRLEVSGISAFIMATIHDEVLLLSDEDCAAEAKDILEAGMIDGWLAMFPDTNTDNLAEAAIADNWSEKT